MHLQLSNCWLALALAGLARASNSFLDKTNSGNYEMLFCGAGEAASNAVQLQNILPLLTVGLQKVVSDARMGTSSPHGFEAFFKTNNNRPTVLRVFQNMIDGLPVTINDLKGFYAGASTAPPTFVCLNEGNLNTVAFWITCQDNPLATALNHENQIILCPLFWTLGGIPSNAMCPDVVNNKFVPSESRLTANQFGSLVRALVNVYATDPRRGSPATTTQDAVNLDATQSVANDASYGLYACSKFHSIAAVSSPIHIS